MQVPILPRVARGETNAIDECLDRYGGLVWSLACRLSPSTSDAEDAVQEIFVDLWRNAGRFREDLGSEGTFVSILARRRLIDRQRKLRRKPEPQSIEDTSKEYPAPQQTSPLELAEDGVRATACLEKLRQNEREVLELSIYHGLTQSRIAERTGAPLGTVKTLIRRALTQLRNCMQAGSRLHAEGGVQL
ncbi:sigma-70 family RNA polymerase sigma factor [Schlesneria paludicola]|uniref:sigma-70 family RNA polymerase sigma factor n=1 Tax=Schlesneria paludicola TaxID=360056 RepID=UPI00029AD7BE|nr:sigma-70 family RNA polymerase sigma factor [Schlesneria paludicola]